MQRVAARAFSTSSTVGFRPLLNRVLVTRAASKTETASGILIPEQVPLAALHTLRGAGTGGGDTPCATHAL